MAEQKNLAFEIKGMDELKRVLARAGQQAPRAMAGPLYRFARQYVLLPAKQKYVPVVTSALKNSLATNGPFIRGRDVYVEVGAGGPAAPYAISVHENPRSGKTGGVGPSGQKYKRWSRVGQWKYLETPAKEAASKPGPLIRMVQAEMGKLFGRG